MRLNQPLRELLGLRGTAVSCDLWRSLIAADSRAQFFQALDTAQHCATAETTISLIPNDSEQSFFMRVVLVTHRGEPELTAQLTPLPQRVALVASGPTFLWSDVATDRLLR